MVQKPRRSGRAAARVSVPPRTPSRAAGPRQRAGKGSRLEKAAARRKAILAAALAEFSVKGFAATRLDDVAKRAGVAKGTIYLHFRDKEALFQELVRTMLVPLVAALEAIPSADAPARPRLEAFVDLMVREVYGTERRNVLRLVLTEGPRFPKLAEFYYHAVVERAMAAMRTLLARAAERGELRHDAPVRFPQLVVAPVLVAILWSGLFDRFAPLDISGLLHAHLDLLFAEERAP
ncbi:MAG TPA: TetR/AcrR family transcriptional regulator [Xanthobacteraceae bacterium]|jgi:AcrR family transcriptional regulator|nr:TetR/AcrR family transcriptional regulator [Xanthobacteraceae bacterium]